MTALTPPDRLQTLGQEHQDSFLTPATRPRFTRARRTQDLRVDFKPDAFNGAGLVVEQVRCGRSSDTLGNVAVSEITAVIGTTRLRAYVAPTGRMTVPGVLGAHDIESRLTALLAAAGSAAR